LVLTREQHEALLRRIGTIVVIAVTLVLLAFAFQTYGNPMNDLDIL